MPIDNFDQDPDMRKAEIVVLIILFSAFAYLGVKEEGRNRLVGVATIVCSQHSLTAASCKNECIERRANPGRQYSPSVLCFAPFSRGRAYTFAAVTGSDCVCELRQGDG
jgi:hypothetical protein